MATSPVDGVEPVQKIGNLIQNKAFLGREFLTWLWHLADTKAQVQVHCGDELGKEWVDVWIDDRILLQPDHSSGHESLMRGGDPSKSIEAAIALSSGKTVKELKLGVRVPTLGEFTANLSYDQLNPKSLQLPHGAASDDSEIEQDGLSHLCQRIELTNIFLGILDDLFLMFLHERTDKSWEDSGLKQIADWIKSKSRKRHGASIH